MSNNQYIAIGKLVKAHGLKGFIKAECTDRHLALLEEVNAVFLNIHGQQLPYFIAEIQVGNDVIIKFEDVETKEDTQTLRGKAIQVSTQVYEAWVANNPEEMLTMEDIPFQGFRIIDISLGEIGEIESVLTLPQQVLAVLTIEDTERYIPIHENLVQHIDIEQKTITMDLPEGILEL